MPETYDIFLSYDQTDKAIMEHVRDDLRATGLTVWTSEEFEDNALQRKAAMESAIRNSEVLVVLMSPAAKDAPWVQIEIDTAEMYNLSIIPLLVQGNSSTAVPALISDLAYIDLREDYEEGIKTLWHRCYQMVTQGTAPDLEEVLSSRSSKKSSSRRRAKRSYRLRPYARRRANIIRGVLVVVVLLVVVGLVFVFIRGRTSEVTMTPAVTAVAAGVDDTTPTVEPTTIPTDVPDTATSIQTNIPDTPTLAPTDIPATATLASTAVAATTPLVPTIVPATATSMPTSVPDTSTTLPTEVPATLTHLPTVIPDTSTPLPTNVPNTATSVPNTATSIPTNTAEIPALLSAADGEFELRYNNDTFVVYNRSQRAVNIFGLEFVLLDETGQDSVVFSESTWEVADNLLRRRRCLQAWRIEFFELPPDLPPADVCQSRTAYTSTVSEFWVTSRANAVFEVRQSGQVLAVCAASQEANTDILTCGVDMP